jgi:hypothetical protein
MSSQLETILNTVNLSPQQAKRVEKVFNEEYYVLDHSEEPNKINIDISGSTKSVYSISIMKDTGKIWCNCPDSKSHAARHDCMCKHCCFTIIKIGKLHLNVDVWQTKCIKEREHIQFILNRLNRTKNILSNENNIEENEIESDLTELVSKELNNLYISKKNHTSSTEVVPEPVKHITKFDKNDSKELTEEDECPICYDYLLNTDVKSCPTCHNYIHTACIQKWLTTKTTCVLCRSTAWSTYFKDHHQNNNSGCKKEKNSDYLQL